MYKKVKIITTDSTHIYGIVDNSEDNTTSPMNGNYYAYFPKMNFIRVEVQSKEAAVKQPKFFKLKIDGNVLLFEKITCAPAVDPNQVYDPLQHMGTEDGAHICIWRLCADKNSQLNL